MVQTASAQVDPARTIATINGEEIKGDEYYRRMEFLPGVGKRAGNAFTEMPPGLLALDQLITERLIIQLARDKGVFPSELELNSEIADRMKADPNGLKTWTDSGRTEADWRRAILIDLCQFKIVTFGVTVTDQDVDRIYNTRGEEFTTPKQYKLSVIVVSSTEKQTAVDNDLRANKPFDEIARNHSEDITKASGGQYGTVPETVFAPAVKTALAATRQGQTTAWLPTRAGDQQMFAKFRVDEIIPAKKDPLTPELRKSIRRKRAIELGNVRNNITTEMAAMRRKARVDIKNPEFAEAYKKLIEAYLGQPSTGGPSGGGGN